MEESRASSHAEASDTAPAKDSQDLKHDAGPDWTQNLANGKMPAQPK